MNKFCISDSGSSRILLNRIHLAFLILFGILLQVSILSCRSGKKFIKMEKPDREKANVYLLRSYDPVLSLYSYQIEIFQLEGSFRQDRIGKSLLKAKLVTGEYCFYRLGEGSYRFQIEKDFSKFLSFQPGKTYYLDFKLIKNGFFEFPEFYLQEISQEEALKYLLESNRLTSCENSMD